MSSDTWCNFTHKFIVENFEFIHSNCYCSETVWAMTFRRTSLCRMTLSIMTFSKMAMCRITINKMALSITISNHFSRISFCLISWRPTLCQSYRKIIIMINNNNNNNTHKLNSGNQLIMKPVHFSDVFHDSILDPIVQPDDAVVQTDSSFQVGPQNFRDRFHVFWIWLVRIAVSFGVFGTSWSLGPVVKWAEGGSVEQLLHVRCRIWK